MRNRPAQRLRAFAIVGITLLTGLANSQFAIANSSLCQDVWLVRGNVPEADNKCPFFYEGRQLHLEATGYKVLGSMSFNVIVKKADGTALSPTCSGNIQTGVDCSPLAFQQLPLGTPLTCEVSASTSASPDPGIIDFTCSSSS